MAGDAQALLLQISADTSRLEKNLARAQAKLEGFTKGVAANSNKAQTALERVFGRPLKGLDQIFDNTRLRALDTGAARIGITGSALEKFGLAGLGAAAAIGALAFALNRAGEAIKFADAIGDTADRLHISTDALQEWRGALQLAGGEEANADAALEAFSVTLGKAQVGLPKAVKVFREIGFTKDQIKGFTDTGDALNQVIAKIAGLRNSGQRDAIISQFGLDGLKELIDKGPDAVAQFTAEIRNSGGVMDAELIKRAGKLNDEIEKLNRKIKIDLHSSFVDLGPLLIDLLSTVSRITGGIERFLARLQPLRNRSDKDLQLERDEFTRTAFNAQTGRGQKNEGNPFFQNMAANANAKAAEIKAEQQRRVDERAADAKSDKDKRTGSARDPAAEDAEAKKALEQAKTFHQELARIQDAILAASDDDLHTLEERQAIAQQRLAAESDAKVQAIKDKVLNGQISEPQGKILRAKQSEAAAALKNQLDAEQQHALQERLLKRQQELASAAASYLDAQLGLASTAQARADLEAQILFVQRATARAVLAQQLKDSHATPLQSGITLGLFDRTTAALGQAADIKKAQAIGAEQLGVAQATLQAQIDAAELQGQLAETAKERRAAELKSLELQYQLQRAQLTEIIERSNDVNEIKKARIARNALDANHPAQIQAVINSTRSPVEAFLAQTDSVDKLNEALENLSVQGLQDVNDGITGLILGTEKWGDVSKRVLADILAGLIKLELQQAEANIFKSGAGSFLSSLPIIGGLFGHRAGGGPVTAGRAYEVGEHGREIFVPPVAGTIISNDNVRRLAQTSDKGIGQVVNQFFTLNAPGAITTEEFVARVDRKIQVTSRAYAAQAAGAAVSAVPARIDSQRKLGS